MSDKAKIWKKAASNIVKAGVIPFPITDTLFKFLQLKMTEAQASFLHYFRKPSMNLEQLKEKTGLPEAELLKMLENLMAQGIVSGTISRSSGIKVYSLMPLFPGIIEFTLMKGESGEKDKKLAALIETYFDYGGKHIQFNVLDRATLLEAQAHPELYRNLIVRVAGYSALFVELDREIQDEIIQRTEHRL